jgi:sporulation protein YlmC with PRC-barrel domain
MSPDAPIKLVSELLDLPLLDSDGKYCGIVDDLDLSGGAGKELKLKALLVGPGAYSGRLPGWAMALVKLVAGEKLIRIPMDSVRSIDTVVHLDRPASKLGLNTVETAAGKWIPRGGAL